MTSYVHASLTKQPARRFLPTDCSVESRPACNLAHAPLELARALSQPRHNSSGFCEPMPLLSPLSIYIYFFYLPSLREFSSGERIRRLRSMLILVDAFADRKSLTATSLRAATISPAFQPRPLMTSHQTKRTWPGRGMKFPERRCYPWSSLPDLQRRCQSIHAVFYD